MLVKTTKNGQATTYTYDPLGRRISKTDTFGTIRYLWAGDQIVQEQRNNLKKTYVFEPENFKPVAQVVDGKTYHYHLDHLGTPRELTDDQGKIVWKVRYKTYGNVAVKEVEEVENNIRFQGQYFDEETGLHYNRFRYYNPNTGQFITQDPIGLLGGVNNYQYAPNPVGWVDPFGLSCKECSTQMEAALAALNIANPLSIRDNLEYGGLIYKNTSTGKYGFTGPVRGTDQGVNPFEIPIPTGAELVGDYHTHGDYSVVDPATGGAIRTSDLKKDDFNSDNFSRIDFRGIENDGAKIPEYRGYLGTPSGTFKEYNRHTKTVSVVKSP